MERAVRNWLTTAIASSISVYDAAPEQMSELDFTTFLNTIAAWKNALVKQTESNPNGSGCV